MGLLLSSLLLFSIGVEDPKPVPKVPVDKNGQPDYEAALNDILGKGIVPEKNANVLLWKAFGPTPDGGTGMPKEFFKRLGTTEPPKDGDYFISLQKFMKDHLKLEQTAFMGVYNQQDWARKAPWTAKDYPHIAAWLKANEKPLAVAMEATKRPDYYNPLVSRKSETGSGSLIGALLPSVQKCRELAAALTARAMLKVGEGKDAEAWQDLLAVHRLARLTGRGATLIESLVAIAIDAIASHADLAFLHHTKLTSKQILDCLKDLQALPAMSPMVHKIDVGERHMGLDALQLLQRGGDAAGPGAKKPTAEESKALAALDWPGMTAECNKWYDRMVAALKLNGRPARLKAFEKIEDDLKANKKEFTDFGALAKQALAVGVDAKTVSKSIANTLMALLLPAVGKVQDAYDRCEQTQRNLHVAFALVAYHRDNNRYPAKLDDLAPKYLATVPDDVFAGKPLTYKPTDKGFLVYSVGANGKDEGGQWYDADPSGDDPGIHWPLPPVKKN